MSLLALLAGCALDVVFPADRPVGDSAGDSADPLPDSGDSGPEVRTAATPVAPSATAPMWQGVQEAFLDADGAPCAATVAAAMSEAAFCFVASGDELRCAGNVHTTDFGAAFTPAGVASARQVLLSPTRDGPDGNALCALGGGVLQCLGDLNNSGQLGTGTTDPNLTLLPWGTVTGVVGAATGTWDQLCALDSAGDAWCAGAGHGRSPVAMGGGHGAVVVDTSGVVTFDDPARWRASAGRSECFVTADGLDCGPTLGDGVIIPVLGEAGHVVDGGARETEPRTACWLDDAGRAWCTDGTATQQIFTAAPVLLLAMNGYTDSTCVIYADGAVACAGSNDHGKLGTGDEDALAEETRVAPPGTVDTRCR